MSDAASALSGEVFDGYARVSEAGLRGMLTLRGDLADPAFGKAVLAVAGVEVPGLRRIALRGGRGACWMSPDELLILLPHAEAPAAAAELSRALAGTHHLVVDVSDARAWFRLEGAAAREVLAKLTPTDLAPGRFGEGELRRTRLAQVPAAFWIEEGGVSIVCFRSVARYVFDVLKLSATPGGEVGLWG